MKDKPIKKPWPLSVKITVWALGILLAGFAVLYCVSLTLPSGDHIMDGGDIHLLNRPVPESLGHPKQSPAKTLREF